MGSAAGAGLAAGVLDDALWADWVMGSAVLGGALVAVAGRARATPAGERTAGALARAGMWGALRGAGLLVCAMASWLGGEIVHGGRIGTLAPWLVRVVLAVVFAGLTYLLLKRRAARGWEYLRRSLLAAAAVAIAVGCVAYVRLTGPRDLPSYPPPEGSPYRLPWEPGIARLCTQSNRGIVSHKAWEEYAYDFYMPVGTVVCGDGGVGRGRPRKGLRPRSQQRRRDPA